MQVRGLQAQLADARQQQKEQNVDKAALQARLQAANDQATAHDAEKSKLQVSALCHPVDVCAVLAQTRTRLCEECTRLLPLHVCSLS